MGIFSNLGSTLSSALGGVVSSLPGSLVSSGISLLGNTILQNHANNQAQDNAKFWADYNTPVNQMKRLREAGLNPNLVYGNGADAQYSGAPSAPSVGSISSPKIMDAMNFDMAKQEIANKKKQGENIDANTNAANATADKENAIAEGQKLENRKRLAENPELMGQLNYFYQLSKKDNQVLQNEFDKERNRIQKDFAWGQAGIDYNMSKLKAVYQSFMNDSYKDELKARLALSAAQVREIGAKISNFAVLNEYYNSLSDDAKRSAEGKDLKNQLDFIEYNLKAEGLDYDNTSSLWNFLGRAINTAGKQIGRRKKSGLMIEFHRR